MDTSCFVPLLRESDRICFLFLAQVQPSFQVFTQDLLLVGLLPVEQEASNSLSDLKHFEAWNDNLQVLKDKGYVFGRLVGFGGSLFSASGNTLCSFSATHCVCLVLQWCAVSFQWLGTWEGILKCWEGNFECRCVFGSQHLLFVFHVSTC